MIYSCPYCSWQGCCPSLAEFETDAEYLAAESKFLEAKENHPCDDELEW
jgi:hypothetical protein